MIEHVYVELRAGRHQQPNPDEAVVGDMLDYEVWLRGVNGSNVPCSIPGVRVVRFDFSLCQNVLVDCRPHEQGLGEVYGCEVDGEVVRWRARPGSLTHYRLMDIKPHGQAFARLRVTVQDYWFHVNLAGPEWLTQWERLRSCYDDKIRAAVLCGYPSAPDGLKRFTPVEGNMSVSQIWAGQCPRISVEEKA